MKNLLSGIVLLVCTAFGQLAFDTNPSITRIAADNWQVSFALNQAADVEVAIVSKADSSIIRHLAAGLLGANAPAPLTTNSNSQTLTWDGKDDLGQAVTLSPSDVTVRVRAGMSAGFDQVVGGSIYSYNGVFGVAADNLGHVNVLGDVSADNDFNAVRQYDIQGNYLKTLFPFAADLPANDVSGFGVNNWLNGKSSPKTKRIYGPDLTSAIFSANEKSGYQRPRLVGFLPNGNMLFVAAGRNQVQEVTAGGGTAASGAIVPLISSPANFLGDYEYFNIFTMGGPLCVSLARDKQSLFLSAIYYNPGHNSGSDATVINPDTGFWRDGQVFRVNLSTGVARSILSLTGVPTTLGARKGVIGPDPNATAGGGGGFAAIHGVTEDDAGHLFICDRHNQRVGVYDTTGHFISGIPLGHTDAVEVNPSTRAVYVTTRDVTGWPDVGYVRLYKYSAWDATPALVCSVTVSKEIRWDWDATSFISVDYSGASPLIWVGYRSFGCKVYRDEGSSLTLIKDFSGDSKNVNRGFDRPCVDRRNETVFFNNTRDGFFKIEDWVSPVITPCSTATRRLYATDMTISPDYQLYIRENPGYPYGVFEGPITRYTLDHIHAPIPFSNTGTNMAVYYVTSRMHHIGGYGEKGLTVLPDKRVAFVCSGPNNLYYFVGITPAVGCTSWVMQQVDTIVNRTTSKGGGLRADLKGNLYLGAFARGPDHQTPAGFETDWAYDYGVGSVVRFPAGDSGTIVRTYSCGNDVLGAVTGADKIYPQGLSPMSDDCCACRSPRFDVDPYGRLYIPNAVTGKVTIADNNGNTILDFGEYGNWDSKGPGSLVPTAGVPMAWPTGAAASENFVYVTDMVNTRLVRVKMDYALNSLPWLGNAAEKAAPVSGLRLTASPNPFNPESRITLNLPKAGLVALTVVDISGRIVKSLAASEMRAGVHSFTWNATDMNGAKVSAGVYIYKLVAGGKVMMQKAILAK
jgi:hypothetical protein